METIHIVKVTPATDHVHQLPYIRGTLFNAMFRCLAGATLDLRLSRSRDLPKGCIGETDLELDIGPWRCLAHAYLLDAFMMGGGSINMKAYFEDFSPLDGQDEPELPEKDGNSYGVFGYIGFDASGALTVQLYVLGTPDNSARRYEWRADLTDPDLSLVTLEPDKGFYGTMEREVY